MRASHTEFGLRQVADGSQGIPVTRVDSTVECSPGRAANRPEEHVDTSCSRLKVGIRSQLQRELASMDHARWQRIQQVYHSALERRSDERSPYLDQACGTDEDLRRTVKTLLTQSTCTDDLVGDRV